MRHEEDVDVKVGVITVSTSRWKKFGDVSGVENIPDEDESGKIIAEQLNCVDYRLVPDDRSKIISAILDMMKKVDVIVTTGGTGISPDDVTIEAVKMVVEKEMEGFGEIFRLLSYNEIGEAAMLTRAFAGVSRNKVIFCLPGSKKAVELGIKLIKPQLKHIVTHAKGLK